MGKHKYPMLNKSDLWKMVHSKCIECIGPAKDAIKQCEGDKAEPKCYLFALRLKATTSKDAIFKLVRQECVSCLHHTGDVCCSFSCPLYPLRMGNNHPEFKAFLSDPENYAADKEVEYLESCQWHPTIK